MALFAFFLNPTYPFLPIPPKRTEIFFSPWMSARILDGRIAEHFVRKYSHKDKRNSQDVNLERLGRLLRPCVLSADRFMRGSGTSQCGGDIFTASASQKRAGPEHALNPSTGNEAWGQSEIRCRENRTAASSRKCYISVRGLQCWITGVQVDSCYKRMWDFIRHLTFLHLRVLWFCCRAH